MTWKSGHQPSNKGKGVALAWINENAAHQGDACLIWPFSGNWNGYGQLSHNGRILKAHRVMCEAAYGPPPTPKHVAAHICNNGQGGCVNPRHLSWKTPRENLLDRRAAGTITKKRWDRYRSKITPEHIAQICALKGRKNQREIAAQFGISYQHVSIIQRGLLRRQQST